jgi:hypothetical protein
MTRTERKAIRDAIAEVTRPTWFETVEYVGMPAARDMQESILLAQLEVLRRIDRKRSGRPVYRSEYDCEGN